MIGISKKEHHTHHQQRINLLQIKKLIDRHLDERKNLYWNTFVKYLQAKLSKTEWDHFVKITFGYEFIALHNYFIKSLLLNAKISTIHHLHPSNSAQMSSSSRATSGMNHMMLMMSRDSIHQQMPASDSIIYPLSFHRSITKAGEHQRTHLLSQQVGSGSSMGSVNGGLMSFQTSQFDSSKMRALQHLSREIIEVKMNRIAGEMGLMNGVDPESVSLLLHSTECYLKHLIEKCLQNKKSNRSNFKKPDVGSYLVKDGDYTHSYRHYTDELTYLSNKEDTEEQDVDKYVITPKDLFSTVQSAPNLVEDLNIKEKIFGMDWDLY